MAAVAPKNPRTPPQPLVAQEADFRDWPEGQPLVRIHRTTGLNVMPWSALREFGPTNSRWDPHPPPQQVHPGIGVMYAAGDITTAVAEVFQRTRRVDWTTGTPHLTIWRPAFLSLLDLTDDWLIRNGASFSLAHGRKDVCRNWARSIHQQIDAEGLYLNSTMTNRPTVVVWRHRQDAFPTYPDLSLPLTHPTVAATIENAAKSVGYRF
ncbi:hypothetical protein BKD30_01105 [Tersicoccus phoenicis]|uniref:RES domain-containing protein n=1 Tax=Tersicoccus phoenicis TaxID=554083 RepID=A0A1R1LPC3_9MICC|nr:RES family NAD+ phosphorylase [Tersicoccus phoenicis]OMH29316.1 hypothetical protein BKD30_01105 [Tersicoccus phoenicis]